MPTESKRSLSVEYDDHEELCKEFLILIEESEEDSFVPGSGVSLGTNNWNIVITAKEGEPSAKGSLIQLFSSRSELITRFLKAEGFLEMVNSVVALQDWLAHRGCVIGIQGNNLWSRIKLGIFDKTSFLFGFSTRNGE